MINTVTYFMYQCQNPSTPGISTISYTEFSLLESSKPEQVRKIYKFTIPLPLHDESRKIASQHIYPKGEV